MALVVFLRGVNVGGHRVFRPSTLPARLPDLGLVNIGAAGTFVVHRRMPQAELRRALARELAFETEIMISEGTRVRALVAGDPFAGLRLPAGAVRFVSVLGRAPTVEPELPFRIPAGPRWLVQLVRRTDRFVAGTYRRDVRTIGALGRIDRLFDVPLTTRSWNTIAAIDRVLRGPSS